MTAIRWVLSWIGWLVGPIVLTAYYLILKARNAGRAYLQPMQRDGVTYMVKVKPRAKWTPSDGMTFGRTIFIDGDRLSHAGAEHELTHVCQYAEHGWWGFLAVWTRDWIRYGYRDIPFESDARAHAAAPDHR